MKRVVVLCALAAVSVACGFFSQHTRRYEPTGIQAVGQPSTGEEFFKRDCAWCHGFQGEGTTRAPNIVADRNGAALTDFMLSTGRMPIEDEHDLVKRGPPAYKPETIQKIVAYVASLGGHGPPVAVVDVAAGDLSAGQELFNANCAACHSATGVGGTLAQSKTTTSFDRSASQIPGLQQATPRQIAEAMRTGPGTMPVFDEKTFTDHQVDSIVRYVLFARGQNEGGAGLGRIGPVAEGAVAWFIGLGVLLLVARWIGTSGRSHR